MTQENKTVPTFCLSVSARINNCLATTDLESNSDTGGE